MPYSIDKSLLSENVFKITTDSGAKYIIVLQETAEGSGLWTLSFLLEPEKRPLPSEVFKTMRILEENLLQILDEKGITSILVYIAGKDREEVDQKTKIFTRWIERPWEYVIESDPIIRIHGKRKEIQTMTNFIHLKKNLNIETNINKRFCTNCGTENKNYKFCPNCGNNLEQT